MVITKKSYSDIIETLKDDLGLELRFTTRVIFINNLAGYKRLVNDLTSLADEVIRLSDDRFTAGDDVIPDLKKVLDYVSRSTDKNLMILSIGEYLRFAKKYESSVRTVRSFMTFPAHSPQRVWMPIYAAKDIFQDVVGDLPSERYELFELDDEADEFETLVYSDIFSNNQSLVSIHGMRQMYRQWDELKIDGHLSFSTRKISMLTESNGNYAVHIIKEPFDYIVRHLKHHYNKLDPALGTPLFWSKLVDYVEVSDGTLEDIIRKALNIASFDAQYIIGSWSYFKRNEDFGLWLLWLWYQLELPAAGDYLCFAIKGSKTYKDIQKRIESSIFDCIEKAVFGNWIQERRIALSNLGISELSDDFWSKFDKIADERLKLKLLTNITHQERTKIIEIVSKKLEDPNQISTIYALLEEKYPDLLCYLSKNDYLEGAFGDYIYAYKQYKIMDCFDVSISEMVYDVDIFEYDSRTKILNALKHSENAYFLWIDGMGVEWIDLLIAKVKKLNAQIVPTDVQIGMAALPTTTARNMKIADSDTVSYKFDQLDSCSHIKDRSDCNYFSIIDKQFDLIETIAELIVESADKNPNKAIVVTADHGMSRMAAKAFHEKQGITPPQGAEVKNLGRYCLLPEDICPYNFGGTYREDNCLAYREHSHFTCSGYAPGEIHGGASPEECLVPIIVFKDKSSLKPLQNKVSYELSEKSFVPDLSGNITVRIRTKGKVDSVSVDVGTNSYLATKENQSNWKVVIPGLKPKDEVAMRINLNNIAADKIEIISVALRGMAIDDDFEF